MISSSPKRRLHDELARLSVATTEGSATTNFQAGAFETYSFSTPQRRPERATSPKTVTPSPLEDPFGLSAGDKTRSASPNDSEASTWILDQEPAGTDTMAEKDDQDEHSPDEPEVDKENADPSLQEPPQHNNTSPNNSTTEIKDKITQICNTDLSALAIGPDPLEEAIEGPYTVTKALAVLEMDLTEDATADSYRWWDHFLDFPQRPTDSFWKEHHRLAEHQGWRPDITRRNAELACAIELWYWTCNRDHRKSADWSHLQHLCSDLQIEPVPSSNAECKTALHRVRFNLVDYLNCKRRGVPVRPVYRNIGAFVRYQRRRRQWIPAAALDAIPWLKEATRL